MSWKKLSSKTFFKSRWMEVTEDSVETESGQQFEFGVVHKKPFAMIIPWDGKKLTLVGQYRYPIDQFIWEFPSGHLEHGDILESACAELKEETGITAKDLVEIGRFYLAPGHHTQRCHLFLATNLTSGVPAPEGSEHGMLVKEFTLNELEAIIKSGEFLDGPSIAALSIAKIKGFIL